MRQLLPFVLGRARGTHLERILWLGCAQIARRAPGLRLRKECVPLRCTHPPPNATSSLAITQQNRNSFAIQRTNQTMAAAEAFAFQPEDSHAELPVKPFFVGQWLDVTDTQVDQAPPFVCGVCHARGGKKCACHSLPQPVLIQRCVRHSGHCSRGAGTSRQWRESLRSL